MPSTRSAPAISASSVAATAAPRSLWGCSETITLSRAGDVAAEPLDPVGVHVRGRHLDRRGQVQDQPGRGVGSKTSMHRLADLERVVELGAGERLGRVLERISSVRAASSSRTRAPTRRPATAICLMPSRSRRKTTRRCSSSTSSCRGGRSSAACPRTPRTCARSGRLAALREHDDRDVVRDQLVVDQRAHEVEVGLRGGREPDLDLLEARSRPAAGTCGACGRCPSA